MKKYKLKKSVLVKANQDTGAITFSVDNDQILKFEGDAARAIFLLFIQSKKDGLSLEELQSELTQFSMTFKNNDHKEKSLEEFFNELQKLNFLED